MAHDLQVSSCDLHCEAPGNDLQGGSITLFGDTGREYGGHGAAFKHERHRAGVLHVVVRQIQHPPLRSRRVDADHVPHEVPRAVVHVRGLLHDLSARLRLHAPPGGSGRVPDPEPDRQGRTHASQQVPCFLRRVLVPPVVSHAREDAAFLDLHRDVTGGIHVQRLGFLDEEVEVAFQHGHFGITVGEGREAYVHGIQFFPVQHLAIIAVRAASAPVGCRLRALDLDVRVRHEFGPLDIRQESQVHARNASGSDKTYTNAHA